MRSANSPDLRSRSKAFLASPWSFAARAPHNGITPGDKAPVWKFTHGSDVYTLGSLPSKNWRPGHNKNEKGLFPHVPDFILNLGLWK